MTDRITHAELAKMKEWAEKNHRLEHPDDNWSLRYARLHGDQRRLIREVEELSARLEWAERALKDLIDTFRNPYDGGEFEHGEVPALDRARAALDKTEPQP